MKSYSWRGWSMAPGVSQSVSQSVNLLVNLLVIQSVNLLVTPS